MALINLSKGKNKNTTTINATTATQQATSANSLGVTNTASNSTTASNQNSATRSNQSTTSSQNTNTNTKQQSQSNTQASQTASQTSASQQVANQLGSVKNLDDQTLAQLTAAVQGNLGQIGGQQQAIDQLTAAALTSEDDINAEIDKLVDAARIQSENKLTTDTNFLRRGVGSRLNTGTAELEGRLAIEAAAALAGTEGGLRLQGRNQILGERSAAAGAVTAATSPLLGSLVGAASRNESSNIVNQIAQALSQQQSQSQTKQTTNTQQNSNTTARSNTSAFSNTNTSGFSSTSGSSSAVTANSSNSQSQGLTQQTQTVKSKGKSGGISIGI